MWIKFALLLIVSIYSLVLGLYISKRNIAKELSIKYFSLMCFSAFVWILGVAISLIAKNPIFAILIIKILYIAAILIFVFFLYFAIYFLYSIKNYRTIQTLINVSLSIIIILISFFLVTGYVADKSIIKEIRNQTIDLIYGAYIIILLTISYFILFKKLANSSGINKPLVKYLIIATLIPFSLGIFFNWYMPHVNNAYMGWWLVPLCVVTMNSSITYLIFKKD